MARGLEAGSFLFGLEFEEEGSMILKVVVVVGGGKGKKGEGVSIGL